MLYNNTFNIRYTRRYIRNILVKKERKIKKMKNKIFFFFQSFSILMLASAVGETSSDVLDLFSALEKKRPIFEAKGFFQVPILEKGEGCCKGLRVQNVHS